MIVGHFTLINHLINITGATSQTIQVGSMYLLPIHLDYCMLDRTMRVDTSVQNALVVDAIILPCADCLFL